MLIYANTLVSPALGITFLTIQYILFLFPTDVESNLEILFLTPLTKPEKVNFEHQKRNFEILNSCL